MSGPTEDNKYVVVERLSDWLRVFAEVMLYTQRVLSAFYVQLHNRPHLDLGGFVASRCVWYERIIRRMQQETNTMVNDSASTQ